MERLFHKILFLNHIYMLDFAFEPNVMWSATPGDSAKHMKSASLQRHISEYYPPAFDHYSFFSSLNASDRVLGVSWIGTACLKFPQGILLAK